MAVIAEFSTNSTPDLKPSPSSLLEATPAPIVRALSRAYPLLCCADRSLGWLTWSSSDKYESFLVLILFTLLVRHLETVTKYLLPLVIAVSISLLLDQSQSKSRRKGDAPTLDEIVKKLESSGQKFRTFVAPLKSLKLTGMETVRFVLATLLFSPLYVLITYLWLTPRNLLLILGIIILSWHSLPFKVARSIAWRFSLVRLLVFVITGIDRTSQHKRKARAHASAVQSESDTDSIASNDSQEVEYTFVIYENQRHWIGIGWTSNLLPEERSPWTDPSLNEVLPIDTFELPDASGTGMSWQWVDEQWQLDVKGNGKLLKFDPDENEGFTYYNNVWSSPSPVSGFSKYTRRRKWVRRAAFVSLATQVGDRLSEQEEEGEKETKSRNGKN